MSIPRATARLQFHKDFGFDDAVATVDYYAALGISHLYASPIFTARRGSTHGYDVVDPSSINPELGGAAGLQRLVSALRAKGMGLIIDIVPNHMGIAGAENPWWQDVLEWGQASRYATWFDIDWQRDDPALHGKVLLPFLGKQYGEILAGAELKLQFDGESGKIYLDYHGNRFPITPASYIEVLGAGGPELAALQAAFVALQGPPRDAAAPGAAERGQAGSSADLAGASAAFAELRRVAATPAGSGALHTALARFAPDDAAGRAALHALLEKQHYRLAWWRFGTDGLNWRRFFEVTELAGMRVENAAVFEATHALTLQLYEQGLIDGVRVDHVDGLADPTGYCQRLRERLEACGQRRPADAPGGPAYIVVEKILAAGEPIRPEWQIDGTTGYDFMDQVGAFLHAPAGAAELGTAWTALLAEGGAQRSPFATSGPDDTGDGSAFAAEVQAARRQLLAQNLAAEMDAACRALVALARSDLATRDYSFNAIRRVYTELLVQFPVYRTYVRGAARDAVDQHVFEQAMAGARARVGVADAALLAQLEHWLGGAAPDLAQTDGAAGSTRAARDLAIRRFQQLTPPLVAKSVEDTAFYRYGRLLSRNQVGSDPGQFSLTAAQFHALCAQRATTLPRAMLATATHDHKRGEDVTARLAVLSEVPREWRGRLNRWRGMNAQCRSAPNAGPSPAEEAMLYQTLIGVWPIGLQADHSDAVTALHDRLGQWQEKALREAKVNTDWVAPDAAYETACREFLNGIMRPDPGNLFLAEVADWVNTIAVAGVVNSLTQTVLRLTVPGVPDLYQGTEFWDFSLVDPDNRRPVDFDARRAALAASTGQVPGAVAWQDGALKQRVVQALLRLRGELPELFAKGDYAPLEITGAQAALLFGFIRRYQEQAIIVIVTRLAASVTIGLAAPAIRPEVWRGTRVRLPDAAVSAWRNVLTGSALACAGEMIEVDAALSGMTVAVLRTE